MSANSLTPEARRENANALAAAIGLDLASAEQALDIGILVTVEPTDRVANVIADEVSEMLRRTVLHVGKNDLKHEVAA
jgi:hypothetical protein